MLSTYQAVLHGDQLEWLADRPQKLLSERGIPVYVTILDSSGTASNVTECGQRMAAALEQLAQMQTSFTALDPLAWERKTREDRPFSK